MLRVGFKNFSPNVGFKYFVLRVRFEIFVLREWIKRIFSRIGLTYFLLNARTFTIITSANPCATLKGPSFKGLEQTSPLIRTHAEFFIQLFAHKDIIKYLNSGDCIWIRYDSFMNDNIESLKLVILLTRSYT